MDELIRRLEDRLKGAEYMRSTYSEGSSEWLVYGGEIMAFRTTLVEARDVKRRMADREPTWTVEP